MSTPPAKAPEILDKIVDLVLAHRPKAKSKAAKKHMKALMPAKEPKRKKNAKRPPS